MHISFPKYPWYYAVHHCICDWILSYTWCVWYRCNHYTCTVWTCLFWTPLGQFNSHWLRILVEGVETLSLIPRPFLLLLKGLGMRLGYTIHYVPANVTNISLCMIVHYFIHRTIMFHPIRCHFSFPAILQDKQVKLKVFEEMAECDFNIQIPIELLWVCTCQVDMY